MGCDIHMFVEYRVDGSKWQAHPEHIKEIENEGSEDEYVSYKQISTTGRNYELFGALAGVRHDGPDAKGVPDDVSDFVKAAIEAYGDDGHSHSYLTLQEYEDVINSFDYFEPTDRTDMFYNWNVKDFDYSKTAPDFTTIISGCRAHANELSKHDDILLGHGNGHIVEHRLVFYFDN